MTLMSPAHRVFVLMELSHARRQNRGTPFKLVSGDAWKAHFAAREHGVQVHDVSSSERCRPVMLAKVANTACIQRADEVSAVGMLRWVGQA